MKEGIVNNVYLLRKVVCFVRFDLFCLFVTLRSLKLWQPLTLLSSYQWKAFEK